MHLLVSVADATEAAAALSGGAHIIDAKDPFRGALGAVAPAVLERIVACVGAAVSVSTAPVSTVPVSAALGDAVDERAVEDDAFRCAAAGAAFVKVGFAGVTNRAHVANLIAAARNGIIRSGTACGVVAVAYADWRQVESVDVYALVDLAARAGASGVLIDTARKAGPTLLELMVPAALTTWVAQAQSRGLTVAVAGKLTRDDLDVVRETGADIVGVRGAACDAGRTGRIMSSKVRELVELVGGDGRHPDAGRDRVREVGIHELTR